MYDSTFNAKNAKRTEPKDDPLLLDKYSGSSMGFVTHKTPQIHKFFNT
jgi:hypothetical protein